MPLKRLKEIIKRWIVNEEDANALAVAITNQEIWNTWVEKQKPTNEEIDKEWRKYSNRLS